MGFGKAFFGTRFAHSCVAKSEMHDFQLWKAKPLGVKRWGSRNLIKRWWLFRNTWGLAMRRQKIKELRKLVDVYFSSPLFLLLMILAFMLF
jgi:hypothetical protein